MPVSDPHRARGAALIIVLVFGLAILMVSAVLLGLSTLGVRDQGQRHQRRSLRAVLESGVADALNEIQRHQLAGPHDPGADGVGALLVGADGRVGVPVRAANGQLLGRYRVTIETTPGGRQFLNVVAAWPDFEQMGQPAADRVRLLQAARLELEPKGFQPGGQPLEISGRASGDEDDPAKVKTFKVEPGATVEVLVPSLAVPAARVGDGPFREAFKALLPSPAWTVIGSDPNNPGAPAADAAAISDAPDAAGISPQAIAELAAGLDAFAEDRSASAGDLPSALIALGAQGVSEGGKLKLKSPSGLPASYELPPGDYTLPGDVVLDGSVALVGSGNLLLHRKKLEVEDGAALTWTGNVLISGSDTAELKIKAGATVAVEGVLAVEGATKKAKLKVEDDSHLSVTGAALLLADARDVMAKEERGEVVIKDGARVTIRGLFTIVGQHVHFEVGKGSRLDVEGALVFAVPGQASKGLHKLSIKNASRVKLLHDADRLDQALLRLRELTSTAFGNTRAPFGVAAVSYWEPPAARVYQEQQAAIDRGDRLGIDD